MRTIAMHAERVQKHQAALACFDGDHCSLAAATLGGRLLLHSPHQQGLSGQAARLNVNKHVTALAAGAQRSGADRCRAA